MSIETVKQLRQDGKLDEALEVAYQLLEDAPDNLYLLRELGWVYYGLLKQSVTQISIENVLPYSEKIKMFLPVSSEHAHFEGEKHPLPETDHTLFDSSAFQIGKIVFAYADQQHHAQSIQKLWIIVSQFNFSKPSDAYSFLFKAFHKAFKDKPNYIEFADTWNFEFFQRKDFESEVFKGKKIMSIVEQAYITYARHLLEGNLIEDNGFYHHSLPDLNKIKVFLPQLEKIASENPAYTYTGYYQAKLLIASNNSDRVMDVLLPFARQKRNDFWVWDLLSDLQQDDLAKISCLCKALSLKTPEEFTVKVRQKLAGLLVGKQLFQEAKTEIVKIIEVRNLNKWKIPAEITNYTSKAWYVEANPLSNNKTLYQLHRNKAESLLYADFPEHLIAIEYVNSDKKMVNFVHNDKTSGFFKYEGFFDKLFIGDLLYVRFSTKGDNFYQIYTARKAPDNTHSDVIRMFEAKINIRQGNTFGFADDIFIERELLNKHQLVNQQTISGKALLSFNKKKNEWGWKAFTLTHKIN